MPERGAAWYLLHHGTCGGDVHMPESSQRLVEKINENRL